MSPIRRDNALRLPKSRRRARRGHAPRASQTSTFACVVAAALAIFTSCLTSYAQPSTQPNANGAKATESAAAPVAAPAATQPLPWFDALPAGLDEARRKNQPVLVDVGAAWCPA